MALMQSLKNLLFQEVDGVVIDLRTGLAGVGVKNDEGEVIVTFVDKGDAYELESNPIKELAMPVPAYAVRTTPDKVKKGDIVVLNDGTVAFFVSSNGKDKVNIVNAKSGREGQISLAKNQLLGTYGILAVANVLNPTAGGGGDFNSLLPFILMKDGGKDTNKLLMFMMMQQNGGGGAMGNLLPLLMFGDKGGSSDAFLMMALAGQGGLGGGGMAGLLPFLFADGKEKSSAAAVQKKPAA